MGNDVLAVTARLSTYPEREYQQAVEFAKKRGIPHRTIVSEELDVEGFSYNPHNRCDLCKKELFAKIRVIANENGYRTIAEGSNVDDLSDYRPELVDVREHGV